MGVEQAAGAGEEPTKVNVTRLLATRCETTPIKAAGSRCDQANIRERRPSAGNLSANNSTLPRNERRTGKNARQGNHAQQVAVEKPPRITGGAPQPFQVPTLHPMGGTHLRPRDEIQSGANANKRHVRQEALRVVGKELLLGCAKGDETEIGA